MLTAEPAFPEPNPVQPQATEELVKDVALAIIEHPHLEEMISTIRKSTTPWKDYQRAGLITENEVAMIEHVENKSADEISTIMSEHGIHYAGMYLELMQKLARVDAVKKVLVMIHDMLNDHSERITLFHQATADVSDFPFGPFHRALQINDEFIAVQSSKILTLLICSTSNRDLDIDNFFRWMTFQLQSPQPYILELNVQILDALFHIPSYRKVFWNTSQAVDSLVNILKTGNSNPQQVYEVTFAIWLLTFDKEIAANLNRKYDVIPTLIEIAKSAVKEKVIRVVVATFKNMIDRAPKANLSAMLVARLLPFVEHLSERKWSDPEVVEDIDYIKGELQTNFENLTTFEVYASELETGKLEWSPPHQSESFWRLNAARLDEDDHKLLKILSRLLHSSTNTTVLAIACHDLGQYVKYCPKDGRRCLESVGAKQRIMELMTHEDLDVRYYALSATQKQFYGDVGKMIVTCDSHFEQACAQFVNQSLFGDSEERFIHHLKNAAQTLNEGIANVAQISQSQTLSAEHDGVTGDDPLLTEGSCQKLLAIYQELEQIRQDLETAVNSLQRCEQELTVCSAKMALDNHPFQK